MMEEQRPPFLGLRAPSAMEALRGCETPCYVLDEARILENCRVLYGLSRRTGCKVLLAQKAFSNYDLYPAMAPYLAGTEASGLYEARLGAERFPGEVHVFSAAYREKEFCELLRFADHIVFNSPGQLEKYGHRAISAGKSIGLRVNPEHSTKTGYAQYDPCARGSRLGTTRDVWDRLMSPELVSMLSGIHFHTLCEQNSDALEETLEAFEERFGDVLPQLEWVNFGGGHHITRPDYDMTRLERLIRDFRRRYGVQVYLEPGEAVALNAGYLVSRVLDVVENAGIRTAVLDMSAACHAPDVLEMPYTPPVYGAGEPGQLEYTFRLGGPTCLAGDVAGEYSFERPLREGDLVIFGDMAIYTTCKNNTFNGMPLPDIELLHPDGEMELLARFGYGDFEGRLGRSHGGS